MVRLREESGMSPCVRGCVVEDEERDLKPVSVADSRVEEALELMTADEEDEEEELECFHLRVVYAKDKTGFQESKTFNWPVGSLVAGRYEVR